MRARIALVYQSIGTFGKRWEWLSTPLYQNLGKNSELSNLGMACQSEKVKKFSVESSASVCHRSLSRHAPSTLSLSKSMA
jgi:hypothetical protein